jgi:apolipoprotein N-acyltransferase
MTVTATAPHTAARPAERAISPLLLLAGGSVLVFFTFMRFSLGEVGWIAFAPYLVFLHRRGSWRRHLALLAVLLVTFLLTVSKMATHEIPWAPVPMFAMPVALSWFVALVFAAAAHRRLGARWGAYAFASMAVALGWLQYRLTPGSSWCTLAHTQLDDLPLVQLAALTGLGGVSFLVALGSGLAAAAWSRGLRSVRADLVVFALLVGAALLYGQARLSRPAPGPPVVVGGVVSPVTHREFHAALANVDTLRALDDELFARSGRAVDRGARIVVWNEIATLVSVPAESALVARARSFARARGVALVMAYALVTSMHPFHDVDQYRLFLPDGTQADQYVKRHPVPGDPDEVGRRHARVVSVDGVRVSGAICYDYGFPGIARDNARDGAELALVPSSDWRGIDPLHGRMAMMNAVAAGLPMVRPVRAATSIVTDAYGRLRGSLRADEDGDGVLVATVPAARVPTLYARTGEVAPVLALLFCVLVAIRARRPRAVR